MYFYVFFLCFLCVFLYFLLFFVFLWIWIPQLPSNVVSHSCHQILYPATPLLNVITGIKKMIFEGGGGDKKKEFRWFYTPLLSLENKEKILFITQHEYPSNSLSLKVTSYYYASLSTQVSNSKHHAPMSRPLTTYYDSFHFECNIKITLTMLLTCYFLL